MKKIKLLKVRNIPFAETEDFKEPLPNKDYVFSFVASLKSVESPVSHGEEQEDPTYKMEVIELANIQEIGTSKKIKYERGHSPSERLRFAIKDWLARIGKDNSEEAREREMEKIIKYYNNKNL